jgi:hypothetical protein
VENSYINIFDVVDSNQRHEGFYEIGPATGNRIGSERDTERGIERETESETETRRGGRGERGERGEKGESWVRGGRVERREAENEKRMRVNGSGLGIGIGLELGFNADDEADDLLRSTFGVHIPNGQSKG